MKEDNGKNTAFSKRQQTKLIFLKIFAIFYVFLTQELILLTLAINGIIGMLVHRCIWASLAQMFPSELPVNPRWALMGKKVSS